MDAKMYLFMGAEKAQNLLARVAAELLNKASSASPNQPVILEITGHSVSGDADDDRLTIKLDDDRVFSSEW